MYAFPEFNHTSNYNRFVFHPILAPIHESVNLIFKLRMSTV